MEVDEGMSDFESEESENEGSDVEIDKFLLPDSLRHLQEDILTGTFADTGGGVSVSDCLQEIQDTEALDFGGPSIKSSKVRNTMSPFLAGLIGQANMAFVRRNFDETLRLCKEAIRADATMPEPYRTLSEMYEELGEHENAFQLGVIAATNGPKDADEWVMLGDKALDLDRPSDALRCYSKAVLCNRSLYEVFLNIIKLLDPVTNRKHIIYTYWRLIKFAPVELGPKILEYAQTAANLCHEDGEIKKALSLLEEAFKKVPESISLDDVNLIVELHLQLKNYRQVLEIIAQYLDVYIEGEEDTLVEEGSEITTTVFRVTNCTINAEIPMQIRAKLAIAIIHLKGFHLVDTIISPFSGVVEEFGDLMIEIAEAFMSESRHVDAFKLFKILTSSEKFSAAQVWFLHAECLRKLGRKEEAVSAYLIVMEKAPNHVDARLIVSELLNDLGRSEEAITALTQDPASRYVDVGMLYEKCCLLRGNKSKTAEFLVVGRLLMSRHCGRFRSRAEYISFVRHWKIRSKQEFMKKYQETEEEPVYIEGKKMPTAEEEFDLFIALCQTAFETKQYPLLQRLTSSALGSKTLCRNQEKEKFLFNLAAIGIFFNKDSYAAQSFFRNLIAHGLDTPRVWNTFNLLATVMDDNRWQRYIIRLLTKKPEHFACATIFANNCYSSGSYKQALSEYLLQFKHQPTPLAALLIATSFLHLAVQKYTNMNVVVPQAMGYLSQYKELRGIECLQEIHYNMGRLHHQLGMYPTAIFHYKQVFDVEAPDPMFDLKREAAFNLSRIYISSKSYDLAKYYVNKYIVI